MERVRKTGNTVVLPVHIQYTANDYSFFISLAQQPPPQVGQDLHIIEASRSHSDTPRSVGLLWTSGQPDTETST
jgi:hypothetical protein